MFRQTLLLTLRTFKKFKSSFFINLFGLSTGLACTLLIFLWVNDELNIDNFHEKTDRLYQVMEHQQYAADVMTTSSTPGVLAETLAEEIPEIVYATVTTWLNTFTLSVDEEKSLKVKGYYVGPDFFNIFSYNLYQGDKDQVLSDKKSIVISRSLANQLFESDDVIGKVVKFQQESEFKVSGVFEGTPANSSYQFDFVLPFSVFRETNTWVESWGNNGPSTHVVLREGTSKKEVDNKIADFIKKKNEESNVTLFLKPYAKRYLYGRYENGKLVGGRIEYVQLFSIIAGFILVIACINFMNLSTARASRRVKEVGIKKAIGARQRGLVMQFLSESVVMAFLALLIAVGIVYLFLPQFNVITDKQISLTFTLEMLGAFIGISLLAGLFAGSYPALYLSGFNPVKILKGEIRGSIGELWARRGLVIFQFTLSVILIVCVLVIYKQVEFVQEKSIGYDKENVIYFEIEGKVEDNLETFLSEIKQVPGVVNAASIGHNMVGRQNNTSGLEWEGKNPEDKILFENVRVSHDLIETLDIEIAEGRSFSRDFSTDTTKIILNEAAIKIMGLEDPVGKNIKLWEEIDLQIIGVAKDFHFQSLHDVVNPLFFILNPENTWNIMVRVNGENQQETIEALNAFYSDYNPGFTFDYNYLDQEFQKQYAAEQRVATLSKYFAGFAIMISCLGLFGLAAFTAERRVKEIGVRKALGSSSRNIVLLLSSDFTKLVIISIVLALPVSFYLIDTWLQRFAYRIDLEVWYFVVSGVVALVIAWLAVGSQAVKAATINPAQCLRDE
ncbi:FtsX-like permease family protein [Fulvivirga sp. RKSG066]|uniref:ABC transporter permease n=1 Tax=Fulvivirga aurantia TaxID=2529383 RepID=UPI0012BC9748|nr:ABC transporter permease [Fulvivirga aurantia]MTI21390.1 FtsX-like permease family protein [Fulvivirga aurantia]